MSGQPALFDAALIADAEHATHPRGGGVFTGTQPSSARAGVFATIPARQAAEASADAEARSASVAVEFTLRNNRAPALPWIPTPTFRTSAALSSSDFMNTYYYVWRGAFHYTSDIEHYQTVPAN